MNTNELQSQWNAVSNTYLAEFCKKHGYDIENAYWVGDEPGTLACINDDIFVGIHEIRYDIDNNVPEETFLKWYDYDLDIGSLQSDYDMQTNRAELIRINYESFCKGAPLPYSAADLRRMKEANRDLWAARQKFQEEIETLAKGNQ